MIFKEIAYKGTTGWKIIVEDKDTLNDCQIVSSQMHFLRDLIREIQSNRGEK